MGIRPIVVQARDCSNKEVILNNIDEQMIVRRISGILQFTAEDDFKPSFDLLATIDCNSIDCLIDNVKREFRDDVAKWIVSRLKLLKTLIRDNKIVIPLCLKNYDEGIRRMAIGILYVARQELPSMIILDDSMSFVVNRKYYEAFLATTRPAIVSNNRFPTTEEMLLHNLNVLTPDGTGGVHRLTRPDKYVILFGHSRWEIPRREIERLANS
jgi:hypothetical protein